MAQVFDDQAQSIVGWEPAPSLRFGGIEYEGFSGPVLDQMRQIAEGPSGPLIRFLALNIGFAAPEPELSAVRRSLQTPFQSLQSLYADPITFDFGAAMGLLATAANRRGLPLDEAEKEIALRRYPSECAGAECSAVSTADFVYTESGGFVNRTLSPRLPLTHRFAVDIDPRAIPQSDVSPKEPAQVSAWQDDDVGHCFGRCGAGCGSWSLNIVSIISSTFVDKWCENGQQQHELWDHLAWVTYSSTGKVHPACEAHDDCVRTWGHHACLPLVPPATAAYVAGLGTPTTWTTSQVQRTIPIIDSYYPCDPECEYGYCD